MTRLLIPDHFSVNDYKTIAKTSPRLKVDRFQVTQRKGMSPLGNYPNLLITHHSSFYYPAYNRDVINTFIEELKRYLAGQKPQHLVDVEKGY